MIELQLNICKDIENLKKQYGKCGFSKIDDNIKEIDVVQVDDFKEFEHNIDNLNGILKSMEEINQDVISNKNLLKSVLEEEHQVKKKYIKNIKNIINAYISFYDYVDGIKQSLEKSNGKMDISVLKMVNSILSFLEKEYSNIGLIVNIPQVGIDKFDSSKHEIVSTERNLGISNNTILDIIKKGFYYNDRNIRYVRTAKVITVLN
jgi:molecular chaperone GrpE (heat shock protein)